MTEGAVELYGMPKSEMKRHHVIPRSGRGVGIRVAGIDYHPSGKDIKKQSNRVPVPDGYHGFGHLMCEMVFRANGEFGLARDHHHTAVALLARVGSHEELMNIVVARVVGGCLVQKYYGVPGERRNWGRKNG